MASEELAQHAEALLNCPVCMEKFRSSAKILQCQHTFCLPCLRRCHSSSQLTSYRLSVLNCPVCRKTTHLPAAGIEALPSDFRVKQFRDLMDKMQRQNKPSAGGDEDGRVIKCSVCQFRGVTCPAEIFCSSCDKNFCRRCADSHRDNAVFRKHVTEPLDSGGVDTGPRLDDGRCRNHNEVLSYFCEQCERTVCTVCVLAAHQQHHVVDVHEAGEVYKQLIGKKLSTLNNRTSKVASRLQQLGDITRAKTAAVDACRKDIEQAADDARQLINRRKTELLSQLDEMIDRDDEEVKTAKRKLRQTADDLRDVSDSVTEMLSRSDVRLTHQLFVELSARIRAAAKSPDVATSDVMTADCFQSGPRLASAVSVQLGSVQKTAIEVRRQVEEALATESDEDDEPALDRQDASDNNNNDDDNEDDANDDNADADADDNDDDAEDEDDNDDKSDSDGEERAGSIACAYDTDEPQPITFSASSSEETERTTSWLSGGAELLWSYTQLGADCRGLSYMSDGELVASICSASTSVGSKLRAFDAEGRVARQMTGSVVARPWSLCYQASSDSVAITDLDSTAVKLLKPTLTIRDLSAWRGAGVIRPLAISSTQSSHYVLTDSGSSTSSRVSLHAPTAARIVKLRAFNADDLSSSLNYVTVDRQDRIILSDYDNCAVYVYSIEGKRLAEFQTRADDAHSMAPQGVAVDASNNILVAEQALSGDTPHRLARYSADGRLIQVLVEWENDEPWAVAYDDSRNVLAIATDASLSAYRI